MYAAQYLGIGGGLFLLSPTTFTTPQTKTKNAHNFLRKTEHNGVMLFKVLLTAHNFTCMIITDNVCELLQELDQNIYN